MVKCPSVAPKHCFLQMFLAFFVGSGKTKKKGRGKLESLITQFKITRWEREIERDKDKDKERSRHVTALIARYFSNPQASIKPSVRRWQSKHNIVLAGLMIHSFDRPNRSHVMTSYFNKARQNEEKRMKTYRSRVTSQDQQSSDARSLYKAYKHKAFAHSRAWFFITAKKPTCSMECAQRDQIQRRTSRCLLVVCDVAVPSIALLVKGMRPECSGMIKRRRSGTLLEKFEKQWINQQ